MIPIIVIAFLLSFVYSLYLGLTTTPHGKVGFKTGLALKFLKEYKGTNILAVRQSYKDMIKTDYSKKLPLKAVNNFSINTSHGDIPVRLYSNVEGADVPLIVFIHGGGWCIGNLDTHDQQCRRITKATGFAVLSVDYTLSPEAKFPTALEETVEVIEKLINGQVDIPADTSRIAIMGDSAGGNIAISSALKLIDSGKAGPIKCIVPVYPVVNCDEGKAGSFTQFGKGYILTSHLMDLFSSNYVKEGQDLRDPYLSPLFSDTLAQLPPCFILTAGYDPLRDEGEEFAEKLKTLGNIVELKRYEKCVHSFFGQQEFGREGLTAIEDAAVFLKKHLN